MSIPQCRICLEYDGDLFSPCMCKGSIKYVHRNCLETWINSTTNANSRDYCSMCGTKYMRGDAITYLLQPVCLCIEHNTFLILWFNSGISAGGSYALYACNIIPSFLKCAIFIYIGLLVLQFCYGASVIVWYKLIIRSVKLSSITISLLLIGMLSVPFINSPYLPPGLLALCVISMFTLANSAVAILFKEITYQMVQEVRASVLPLPDDAILDLEEKI